MKSELVWLDIVRSLLIKEWLLFTTYGFALYGVTGGFRQRAEDRRPDVGAELMGLVQGRASASESGEIQIPSANRIDA